MKKRWYISTTVQEKLSQNTNRPKHQKDSLVVNVFNDFFSIGADAKIALDFHLARGTHIMMRLFSKF